MDVVVAFASNTRLAERQLKRGWVDDRPEDCAFWFPDEACVGQRVAYFIGGKVGAFVGLDRVISNWRRAGAGPWQGLEYLKTEGEQALKLRRTAEEVTLTTGLPRPKDACIVSGRTGSALWAYLKGRELPAIDRAIEGARTESRSRRRSSTLRAEALRRAQGTCAGCGVDFTRVGGGLGSRALVVHHLEQIRDYDEPSWTSVDQLAVVCANCHMMIHSDPSKALSLSELKKSLR